MVDIVDRLTSGRMDERTVEYPYVLKFIPHITPTLLDVGCLESNLSVELMQLGCEVVGVDVRRVERRPHDVITCDARFLPLRDEVFDQGIAVSTIEHIGMICYGLERLQGYKVDSEGDRKALLEVSRVTKRYGTIIVTLPYGYGGDYWYRSYQKDSLLKLLHGFAILNVEFYMRRNGIWSKAGEDEVSHVVNEATARGCVCLLVGVVK